MDFPLPRSMTAMFGAICCCAIQFTSTKWYNVLVAAEQPKNIKKNTWEMFAHQIHPNPTNGRVKRSPKPMRTEWTEAATITKTVALRSVFLVPACSWSTHGPSSSVSTKAMPWIAVHGWSRLESAGADLPHVIICIWYVCHIYSMLVFHVHVIYFMLVFHPYFMSMSYLRLISFHNTYIYIIILLLYIYACNSQCIYIYTSHIIKSWVTCV